jgi:hypothetical protein
MMALFAGLTARQGRSRIALRSIRATRRRSQRAIRHAYVSLETTRSPLAQPLLPSREKGRPAGQDEGGHRHGASGPPSSALPRALLPQGEKGWPRRCARVAIEICACHRQRAGGWRGGAALPSFFAHSMRYGGAEAHLQTNQIPLTLRQRAFTIAAESRLANHHQIFDIAVVLLSQVASCGRHRPRFAPVLREAG